MKTKGFLLVALYLIVKIGYTQQNSNSSSIVGSCGLGSIITLESTICAGEAINLVSEFAGENVDCFAPNIKQVGNQNFEVSSTHRDSQGNYYLAGAFNGSINIDGIQIAGIGNRDIFLAKYNSCGQILWATKGGSSGDQDVVGYSNQGIASDASGNVYLVGRYNQNFTFYGSNSTSFSTPWTPTSNGNHQDGFLVKLNPAGQVVWGASLRGSSNDGFNGVEVDNLGNVIVTGGFNGCCPSSFAVIIYGPNGSVGVNSFGSNYGSGIVVKFDSAGNILWNASVYNRDTDLGSIAIDNLNNVYLTSAFRSWSNGTPAQFIDASGTNNSLFNPGIGLGFLVKLNSSGNWQWGATFGNSGDGVNSLTYGSDVDLDEAGNPWVVGFYRGAQATIYSTNGANLSMPATSNDMGFLIAYNPQGVAQTVATRQHSTGSTYFRSLAIANNKIAIAGYFTGSNAGLKDILVANYSLTGALIDTQVEGGPGEDVALSIIPAGNSFAVCGSTAGGYQLDGVNISNPCSYLWHLGGGQSQTSVSWSTGETSATINVSPITTTTYTATFSNGINSCTQEVVVNVAQTSASNINASITQGENYSFNSQSLTTAGTYTATLQNAAGCDSVITLNLEVLPPVNPISCEIQTSDSEICVGSTVQINVNPPCIGSNNGNPNWELLIPITEMPAAGFNAKPFSYDRANQVLYSAFSDGSTNKLFKFDLSSNSVSELPASGWFGRMDECTYDHENNRIIATRSGRDRVYSIPASGGTWTLIGEGSLDNESYGGMLFWNSFTNRPSIFGGYGFFQVKNWIWENTSSGWINTRSNLSDCQPAKRSGGSLQASNQNYSKYFLFSGQGSCDGNQFASSCSLGSPWQTDVGQYCWLRDLWELDLNTYQFTNILPANNQTIVREGSLSFDYESNTFYTIGGYVPTGSYGVIGSPTMDVARMRRNVDDGFLVVPVEGNAPPISTNYSLSIFDELNNRIIYARADGIWALNLSGNCDASYSWSTGETTPSISVSPSETTTYSVTVTQGNQTCTSEVTINVNQPSAVSETATACNSYTWNGNTYTQSGNYTWTGTNAAGCDSVVTLNLTITPQPEQPQIACWQSANFNTTTCSWDVTGTQPAQPTNLACWQSANFNTTTCSWDVTGTQPAQPTNLACWQTANFNTTTCSWDVTGTQPAQPTNLACWQTANFNTTSCSWDVTGTPAPALVTNASACVGYIWEANGETYSASGQYSFNSNCQDYTLNLTINQPGSETVNASITQGESYSFNGQSLTSAGTYTATLQNAAGCDSVVTLNLEVLTILNCTINASEINICPNAQVDLEIVSDLLSIQQNSNGVAGQEIQGYVYKGMLNGKAYYMANTPGTWTAANQNAINAGGHLATINSEEEQQFIANLTLENLWIGFTRNTNSNQWEWITGEPVTYLNWRGGEPNGFGENGERFAHMLTDNCFGPNQWNDLGDIDWNGICYSNCYGIMELGSVSNNAQILWSTGETTPSITVSPTETTTYSVTVTQGNQTCTSEVTLTVNQPTSEIVNATITEGESYSFNGQSLTTAGTYTAALQNAAGCDSTVTLNLSVVPQPLAGCYAATVIDFAQGLNSVGLPVEPARSHAIFSLGAPEAVVDGIVNFVSLGFGGSITLAFEAPVANGAGADIRIDEATWGNNPCNRYPETADVFASQDGISFVYLGRGCQDMSLDLGPLSWAQYIRITDVSDILSFRAGSDGYDVNGIECLNGTANPTGDDGLVGCSLQEVVSYTPGNRKNGTPVVASRSNPANALGAPQNNNTINFTALGFGGTMVAKFDYVVFNQPGNDLRITETSFGNPNCANYPEKARISMSLDNLNWVDLGEICQDGEVDLGTLPYAQYIKIQDASPLTSTRFSGTADGFDVDAVVVLNNGCGTAASRSAEEDNTTTADETPVMEAYPNPMADETSIRFGNVQTGANIRIELFDAAGRIVLSQNARIDAEQNVVIIPTANLAKGMYHLVVNAGNESFRERLVK